MVFEELLKTTPEVQRQMIDALGMRDKLMTKISAIDLWLYHVETNMFYVMFLDGQGQVQTSFHAVGRLSREGLDMTDPVNQRKHPLSDESQVRWNRLLYSLAADPTLPEEGHIDLDYHDHSRRIRSYYSVLKDEKGKPIFVVGDSEDMSRTREKMQQVIEEQNDYIRIINGFKSSYETIIYIDLCDHTYKILEATREVRELAEQHTDARHLINSYIAQAMKPADQELFRKLALNQDFRHLFNDRKYVSFEYDSLTEGWLKMRILPAEYNQKGELTHIILSTESVAEEHREKDQLMKRSEHDGLTGLYNRAAGVSRIEKLLKEQSGLLVLFDCDKFKSINDTFGHLVGDKVLVEVANTLTSVFEDQVLFRLGGDEFVAYLTQEFLDSKAAKGINTATLFEMLQDQLSSINIPEMCGQFPTLSGGAARSDKEKPIIFDELYKLADLALYQSKKYGRKKVTMMNLTFGQLTE